MELENQIDFEKLEQERLQLVTQMQQIGTQAQTASLIQKSLDFRTGRMNSDQYYRFMIGLAQEQEIQVKKDFSEVLLYARLVRLPAQIETARLFKELQWAENEVKEKLFASSEEKELDQIRDQFNVMLALRDLTLTREQWNTFSQEGTTFDLRGWREFVEGEANQLGLAITISPQWDQMMTQLSPAIRFYEDAIQRDSALATNFFEELDKKNIKVAFLVTGGFHTSALTQQMKAKDISYAVITPRMSQAHDNKLYMSLIMGEKTAMAVPSFFPNDIVATAPEDIRQQLAADIQRTATLTVASISGQAPDQDTIDALKAQGFDIRPLPGRAVMIEYPNPAGGRLAVLVENRPIEGRTNLVIVEGPTPVADTTEGPVVTAQGGLAPALQAQHGATPRVLIQRGPINVVKGRERDGTPH